MPIDLSAVNWIFVGLMAVLAFVAALLGSIIAFRNRFIGAIIAGMLFAAGFVAWNYYPHQLRAADHQDDRYDGTPAS